MGCKVRSAGENDNLNRELGQLVFGRGRYKYRVIFTVRADDVVVLDIRHFPLLTSRLQNSGATPIVPPSMNSALIHVWRVSSFP